MSSVRRISGLSCSISRGESSPSVFTSTLSMTASKIFSRALNRTPTSTCTTMPFLYFPDLSPSRIVAVFRCVRSCSATIGEEKLRAYMAALTSPGAAPPTAHQVGGREPEHPTGERTDDDQPHDAGVRVAEHVVDLHVA